MDPEPQQIREFFARREHECRIRGRTLERKLTLFRPIRWVTLVFGVVSGALGSAAVFTDILGPKAAVICGLAALFSGILTALHQVLQCDAYQAHCERLIDVYESIAAEYQDAQLCPVDRLSDYQERLAERFSAAKDEAKATTSVHFRRKAERQIAEQTVTDKPA